VQVDVGADPRSEEAGVPGHQRGPGEPMGAELLDGVLGEPEPQVDLAAARVLPGLDPAQREAYLKDNCDKTEQVGYMKHFTPEQLAQMKETLSEVDIKLNDVQEELKEVKADFRARIEPLADERKELLTRLKNKAEYVTEFCYKIVDCEAREVGFYSADGDLVSSRQAFADELQGNLFHSSTLSLKTGTNQ
jgi:hypothetical protein